MTARHPRTRLDVTVQVATSRRGVPHARNLRLWAQRAFEVANRNVRDREVHVGLRVVDARESRTLNRTWRGKDKPTNVLSFPANELLPEGLLELGDIVICAQVVAQEAREQGKTLADHWAHMVVHGILHLLGYDHVRDRDAVQMERSEARILSEFNVANPYLVQPRP